MNTDNTLPTINPQPELAAALLALIASPLGATLAAMLPAGVLPEIGAVLERAVVAEARARAEAAEAQRALIEQAAADRARADAAEARVRASDEEIASMRSRLGGAEARVAALTDRLSRVRARLCAITGAVAETIAAIDEPIGAGASKQESATTSAGGDVPPIAPSAVAPSGISGPRSSMNRADATRPAHGPVGERHRDAGRRSDVAAKLRENDRGTVPADPRASRKM